MRFPFRRKEDIELDQSDNYFLGSSEHFGWRAIAGKESVDNVVWITRNGIAFLERVYSLYKDEILKLGDANRLPIQVVIKSSSECQGGIGGATANGELSYCAGTWASNGFCYGILAHELCNLFTGECVSAGWPEAWWANHRSPFPTMIANQALRKLVPEFYRTWGDYNDPLVLMFERLHDDNQNMFPKMFQKMREVGVNLSKFQEPYLSHVVYSFMFHGAGTKQISNRFISPPMPLINPTMILEIEGRFGII